jgi:RimJ/RimL family protein N-acetyltransferase
MASMQPLAHAVLEGSLVRMEPLSAAHIPALVEAANQDAALYAWNVVPQSARSMTTYVETALAGQQQGHSLPFAIVRRADQTVVGSTRFAYVERWPWPVSHPEHLRTTPDVCEIGYTWLARSAIRTGINTQAKRLLLTHAFESWGTHRVTLRTDVRNNRSRAAIERIGARLDGVLRCERPGADGSVRDSAMYSIIAAEWPGVRSRLERLEQR